jgi:hypothetical protein
MKWRHVAVVVALALPSGSAVADDATIQDFSSAWHGVEVATRGDDAGLALTPEDLDVQVRTEGTGFALSWIGFSRTDDGNLVRQESEASFMPTDRPGVFAFDAGAPSLFSRLFADPATGNPLVGETLLWARLAGPTLTVYSLAIDDRGGFALDRYARSLTDQGMTAHYTLRTENDLVLTVDGRLEAGE